MIRILDPNQRDRYNHYVFNADFSVTNIKKFAEVYISRQAQQGTGPKGGVHDEGGAKVLVSEQVMPEDDHENDIFLMTYTAEKGGGKDVFQINYLSPIVAGVARKLIGVDNFLLQKTTHGVDDFSEKYTYNVFFFPRGLECTYGSCTATLTKEELSVESVLTMLKKYAFLEGRRTAKNQISASSPEVFDITSWAENVTKSATSAIESIEDALRFIKQNEIVGFFFGSDQSPSYESCIHAVIPLNDMVFAYSDDPAIRRVYGVQPNTFVLFDQFGEVKTELKGPFSISQLRGFIESTGTYKRMIITSNWRNEKGLSDFQATTFLLVRDAYGNSAGDMAEEVFRAVARTLRGKMLLHVYNFKDSYDTKQRLLPLSEQDLPVIMIVDSTGRKHKYLYEGDFSVESITKFADDFLHRRLTPYFISQPNSIVGYEGNVRIVVGSTFEQIVLDERKDVFVMLDKNWLEWLSELADLATKIDNLVIARMDYEGNEINGNVGTSSVGLLYLRGKKDAPIAYDGPNTFRGCQRFLEKHLRRMFEPDYEL